eukprot:1689896-Pyramimonas_sp.AAC.1
MTESATTCSDRRRAQAPADVGLSPTTDFPEDPDREGCLSTSSGYHPRMKWLFESDGDNYAGQTHLRERVAAPPRAVMFLQH